jgi:hypothetical protein
MCSRMYLCTHQGLIVKHRVKKILISSFLVKETMRKAIAIIRAFILGKVTIDYVGKTLISRTPGDVTEVSHN